MNAINNAADLKHYANQYALLGLCIGLFIIMLASFYVSLQTTGAIDFNGIIQAQMSTPFLWILDLTPILFFIIGHSYYIEMANKNETDFHFNNNEDFNKNGDFELKSDYENQHDSLTHLPNIRLFLEQLSQAIRQLEKGNELAVIVLKINEFKSIYSNFGHFNTNQMLKQFTKILTSMLAEPFIHQATAGINTVARIENDEFALLLTELNKNVDLNELLSAITKAIAMNFMFDGINATISTTSAIAVYPQHGDTEASLLNHVRVAVYYARKEGNPFAIYNTQMKENDTSNRIVINELSRAIEHNELEIFYQPTVDLTTGRIVGAEALARFDHEESGLVSADQFIPLIEGTNLIHQLTSFLLIRVIKQLAQWHKEKHMIYASVNLSAKDAIDRELPAFIEKLLNDHDLAPEYLKLEFTERACLADQAKSIEVLYQLSNLGVKISIDDFCSGYSSFVYLTNFPINEIKIEKSLIINMGKDKKKAQIVEAIIKLAQTLKLNVSADGIADKIILEQLQKLGCPYGQGFYFSKAINHKEFKALLENYPRF